MTTDLHDFFACGGDYPAEKISFVARAKCCESCAFRSHKPTVRPDDVSLETLVQFTADMDSFFCHQPDPSTGQFKVCAAWHAYQKTI